MEEFQPENREKLNINAEEVAKQYAEHIRQQIIEYKKSHLKDANFVNIDPEELESEDLIMVDKLIKKELADVDLENYRKNIAAYREQKKSEDKYFSPFLDSRSNLYEWVVNKFISLKYERRHPEKPQENIFANFDDGEKRAA